jgi:four helix bundle protein
LDAWKLGIELADAVYSITKSFPTEEQFGLTSQLQRAAVSVSTNIAEGAARGTDKDFCRFLYIARGSLAEIETLVLIATNAGLIDQDRRYQLLTLRNRTAQTLQGLIRSIKG